MHPDWNILDSFLVQKLHGVLKNDAKNTTRPMTYYTESPAEVKGLFDDIAYAKCKNSIQKIHFLFFFLKLSILI